MSHTPKHTPQNGANADLSAHLPTTTITTYHPTQYTEKIHRLYHDFLIAKIDEPVGIMGLRLSAFKQADEQGKSEIIFADSEFTGRLIIVLMKLGAYQKIVSKPTNNLLDAIALCFADSTFSSHFHTMLESTSWRKYIVRGGVIK